MTKRFYKNAEAVAAQDRFALTLDGKSVKTPAGNPLTLPTKSLADAIAAEWNAQGDDVDPRTMPLMQLASTAIDRIAAVRDDVVASVAGYGQSDLLCHREDADVDLAARQAKSWQPHLDWLAGDLGIDLAIGGGIMPITQDAAALGALREHVAGLGDDMVLAGFAELTALLGSVVLALAVFHGRLNAEQAFALSHLDETYQEERWGTDSEAEAARTKRGAEVADAARFLALLRG